MYVRVVGKLCRYLCVGCEMWRDSTGYACSDGGEVTNLHRRAYVEVVVTYVDR